MVSFKIPCDLEGHLDLWGQLQGKRIFFLYRFVWPFITSSILFQFFFSSNHFKFSTVVVAKGNFRLNRYYVINILKLAYIRCLLSDWAQTSFSKIRFIIYICILKWYVIKWAISLTKWRKPSSLIHKTGPV